MTHETNKQGKTVTAASSLLWGNENKVKASFFFLSLLLIMLSSFGPGSVTDTIPAEPKQKLGCLMIYSIVLMKRIGS